MSDERARSFSASTASAADDGARGTGTTRVKRGLADMMKGGVIMDVVNAEQARIAEDAGLNPPHGCRMGICHQCSCRKTSGTVVNRLTGKVSGPGEESVQLCVSVPRGPVQIDV